MRQAGRYLPEYKRVRSKAGSFLDLCYAPELAAEVTLQPVRRFGLDAAILFSDILLIPHGLGQPVEFREKEGPVLEPVRSIEAISALNPVDLRDRLAPVYAAIKLIKENLPAGTALIGFAGAPWTVATYMVEGGTSRDCAIVKGWALREPDEFDRLIDVLVSTTVDHLVAQADAGVDAVQIFESWAGIVPAGVFDRLCLKPLQEIAARFKHAHPEIPLIAFPRDAGLQISRVAAIADVDAVSIDSGVSPAWARRELQPSVAVQGNLDSVALLEGGRAMRAQAGQILEALSDGPFVFNLGHGILPATPPAHVAELVEFVHTWRR